MVVDDTMDNQDDASDTPEPMSNDIKKVNTDVPDFVKDIHLKSGAPVNMDVQFIPQNPYTMTTDATSLGQSEEPGGVKEHSPFSATARAEAYDWNYTTQGIHAAYEQYEKVDPLDDPVPPDWNSKNDPSKFQNIQPQYLKYLFDATGPKDQQYRLQRVMSEQQHDETLANGSWQAKLFGGVVGIVTDPISYIPVVGWAKYAKLAPTFFKGTIRAFPGMAAYGTASSAMEQSDKINGNVVDFLTDSFTRAVFSSVLFGVGGALSLSADRMELWNLKKITSNYIEGIDYKLATDESGKVNGFKAHDTTGNLSAAKVSFAQDLANSSFSKSGVFKIPFVGEGIKHFLGMPVFGSPIISLINSPYKTVRGVIDRVADHSFITKGVEEGEAAPKKFASLMNQTFARLTAMSAQMDALHLERNGFKTDFRPLGGLVNLGLNLKDKGLKLLAQDIEKTGYVPRETFDDEIENVLINEVPSNHATVNEAASMMRKQMDETYSAYREAYNLSPDWMPPKTAQAYLMRVYNTPFMNSRENEWVDAISQWLKESDRTINNHMQPITELENKIKAHETKHINLIARPNITDREVKISSDELFSMKARKKAMENKLQNDLRSNPDLILHVEDWNALSADEAKQINQLTKKRDIALKEVNERKQIIAGIKDQISKRESASIKSKTVKTAKGNKRKSAVGELVLEQEESKLAEVQREYEEEIEDLQQKMHNGEIDNRLFTQRPGSFIYDLKDPNNRLRFRDVYGSEKNPMTPEAHAKAYYDTIMHQTAEDTINQVMGRFTGNKSENPIKQRTLLIPDKILYDNGFMAKNLMAKVSNYTSYLARRTHLKDVFNDVSHGGGFDPILSELTAEHGRFRAPLNEKIASLKEQLNNKDLLLVEKRDIEKQIKSVEKEFTSKSKQFDKAKKQLNHLYEKMMGIQKTSRGAQQIKSAIMSITSWVNLPFVPLTQINDVSAIGLQHGMWPFVRDGVYPLLQSLGGILKTKDSESFRKTAPSIDLALQDVNLGYADRNWGSQTNPYLNMGKWVDSLQAIAHSSSNFTLTNYVDNALQRFTAAVTQSNLMRILHDFKAGTMSKRDGLYIRKYGIDPKVWADRMIEAFNNNGGGKTKLGGYQSLFWQWEDLAAANEFSRAVFRTVKDTNIQSGIADSPFWLDDNGPIGVMGSILKGFSGWGFASINRYVVPSMQQPDAQKLVGVMFMLATGAMVDPMRRMARGEQPFPDNVTDKQMMWSAINNSGYFSFFANVLSNANMLTGNKLLGDLRNDKYKNRSRAGLLGPAIGTANRMWDIITALGSGEMNESDAKKAARMLPFANASWTSWMSNKIVESLGLPKTRAQARALKQINE